jgi:hypothetical protein
MKKHPKSFNQTRSSNKRQKSNQIQELQTSHGQLLYGTRWILPRALELEHQSPEVRGIIIHVRCGTGRSKDCIGSGSGVDFFSFVNQLRLFGCRSIVSPPHELTLTNISIDRVFDQLIVT